MMTLKTRLALWLHPTPAPLTLSTDVADLISQLVAEKAVNAELRAEIATLRTHFDWMATHVNEVKLERAQLYQRLGVFLPVPEITRAHGPLPAADNYVPPTGPLPGDVLAAARELRDRVASGQSEQHGVSLAIFEDMGDEAAERQHIDRAPATGALLDTTR